MKLAVTIAICLCLCACVHLRGAFQGEAEVPPTFIVQHECLFFEEAVAVVGFRHGAYCGQMAFALAEWKDLTRQELVAAVFGEYTRGKTKQVPCGGDNGPGSQPGNPGGDPERTRPGERQGRS